MKLLTMAGTITGQGYRPENHEHRDMLLETVDGRKQGRAPAEVPVSVLIAAGHPPARTSTVVGAYRAGMDADGCFYTAIKRHGDLRQLCLACAENAAEVRRCRIIDCPVWPYRMGFNPHNPRRGIKPAFGKPASP